ncbi:MAG: hypothetical protein FK730_02690 [Asgard group archaeon]|nr:hypothetical protein [Asgard group archaeon]
MLKRKKTSDKETQKKNIVEPIIYIAEKAPKETQEITSELISMRGIIKLLVLEKSGQVIYSYERWGKSEKTLNEDDVLELINNVSNQLKKIDKKSIDHTIIRSEDSNIVIFSTDSIITFLQSDKKAKLPLVTIKTKRIADSFTDLVKK